MMHFLIILDYFPYFPSSLTDCVNLLHTSESESTLLCLCQRGLDPNAGTTGGVGLVVYLSWETLTGERHSNASKQICNGLVEKKNKKKQLRSIQGK